MSERDNMRRLWPSDPPRREILKLRVRGVSRDAESPNNVGVLVSFSRRLTDAELRFFHEVCERTAPLMDGQDD